MQYQIAVPSYGDEIRITPLLKWCVEEGATVRQGEVVARVESQKTSLEIEAEFTGVCTRLVADGVTVTEGEIIGRIDYELTVKQVAQLDTGDGLAVDEIIVPQAGEWIQQVIVARWHVNDGAVVRQGEPLATVETKKVAYELEATFTGRFTCLVPEGERVDVGEVIGRIEHGGYEQALEDTTQERRPFPWMGLVGAAVLVYAVAEWVMPLLR